MVIDLAFDFRSDATTKDPDQSSPTLRRYHQLLWSKPLPNGLPFDLDTTTPGEYLHHRSNLGEFFLSSDSVIATYSYWQSTASIIAQLTAEEIEAFERVGYTIGGMMVFPSNQIDRKPTINAARGASRTSIADRMDLTLECIRRFYAGDMDTPLGATLERYERFFALFDDFERYVQFFLLQDLVRDDRQEVKFFLPFNGFNNLAIPADLGSYLEFRQNSISFVEARNQRIAAWVAHGLPTH
jgi:hypothetical protein